MQHAKFYLSLAALLVNGALLAACGNSNVHTSSPSSTLGTDSSATKVGGTTNGSAAGSDTTTAGGTTGTGR